MKTTNGGEELHLATAFGFTVSEFHAGLSGCRWFIPPSSLQERNSISKSSPEVQWAEQPLSRPGERWQEFRRSEEIGATTLKWSDSHKLQLKKGCLDLSTQGGLFVVFFFLLFWTFYELARNCPLSETKLGSQGTWWKLEVKANSAFS